MTKRVAMLSVHTCPLAGLGGRDTGGMNVYVRQLARELALRNIAVDVFTRQRFGRGPRIVEDGPGVRVIHLEAGPPGLMDKETIYEHLPEFAARVDEFRQEERLCYDRIHAHYWLSGLVAADLRRRWNVPSLVMFHTLARVKNLYIGDGETADSELRAQGEQRAMDSADCIIAANAVERDHMLSQYRVAPDKIAIAPLGVDTVTFKPRDRQAARATLGLAGKQLVFSVGRIEPLKGMDTLVRAAGLLVHDDPTLRERLQVLIGGGHVDDDDPGGGTELARLRALIERLGLSDVVHLLGSLPQSDLPQYYAAADCVVVPSHYESFGLVAVEAMACGAPVVASRVGGLGLSVQDGKTGFLVPARDDAAFAERIGRLLTSPELVAEFGQAAAQAGRAYSWRSVADRILDLYAQFGKTCTRPAPMPAPTRRYATTCGC
ncbi:MAG TPA: glycosyltransferase [Chloroflexota bacterium]|nr:glycosyltransferase [Chloroflexota bacterium]